VADTHKTTEAETDDDLVTCESCSAKCGIEESVATADGCDLCPKCWAEAKAHFEACEHEWVAETDDCGEPAHACNRCSFIVCDADFPDAVGYPAPERKEQANAA
jgi:hypothetical protein